MAMANDSCPPGLCLRTFRSARSDLAIRLLVTDAACASAEQPVASRAIGIRRRGSTVERNKVRECDTGGQISRLREAWMVVDAASGEDEEHVRQEPNQECQPTPSQQRAHCPVPQLTNGTSRLDEAHT
jgi:hypothetical protein